MTSFDPREKPIRVALGITELEVGGAERALVEIATRVDRAIFEPHVFALSEPPQRTSPVLVKRLTAAGIPVQFFGARQVFQFPRVLTRVRRWLKDVQPQVVQTFLFHANLVARLAARVLPDCIVVAGIRVAERQANWHLILENWTSGLADAFVCVSEGVKKHLLEKTAIPREKLRVIPNGVDWDGFQSVQPADRSTLGVPHDGRLLLFVGRLHRQKGVDLLLQAARLVMLSVPQTYLMVVGEGPWRRQMEKWAARLGIAERVRFLGWHADVAELMATADLLLLTSRWEGMPNVLLEAMALGKPLVAFAVEGTTELLGEGSYQLVTAGDVDQLAQKAVRILQNRQLALRLGNDNRQRARRFSWDLVSRQYQELWLELLRQRQK